MAGTRSIDLCAVFEMRPFTSAQARDAGSSRWQLRRLLDEEHVRRVLRDVYVCVDVPDSIELRLRAARLVVPPHAVAVDRTAAWLWSVDAFRSTDLVDGVPPLELFVPPGCKRLTRGAARGGERMLVPGDVVTIDGVQVTTPQRTALDLARRLSPYEALAALDALARAQGVTVGELERLLPRFRGWRGVVQARRLVPLTDPRSESSGESFGRLAIHDAGLPIPEPQVWVWRNGVPLYRLDLAYPELKICIEYDGQAHHSSEADRAADRRRRAWLRSEGWIVIVITKDDFKGPALFTWLGDLRRALESRQA